VVAVVVVLLGMGEHHRLQEEEEMQAVQVEVAVQQVVEEVDLRQEQ
jgi:hypothetical protein